MTRKHRIPAAALAILFLVSALPLPASAEQDGTSFGWYSWVDGEYVWIEAELGQSPGLCADHGHVQTQDPAHEKTLLDNNLLQLTVTGYHNTRNVVITASKP